MAIVTLRNGICLTIKITGCFDFGCRADFRASYIDAPRGTIFVVDIGQVDYLDSSALGMLLLLRERTGNSSNITIAGAHGQPLKVLQIAHFHRIFRFE